MLKRVGRVFELIEGLTAGLLLFVVLCLLNGSAQHPDLYPRR